MSISVFALTVLLVVISGSHGQFGMPPALAGMGLQQPPVSPIYTNNPVALRNPMQQKIFNNLSCDLENESFHINDDYICQCRTGKIVCSFPQACLGDKRYQCPPQNIQCPSSGIIKKDCNFCYCTSGALQCYTSYLCPKMVPPIWDTTLTPLY